MTLKLELMDEYVLYLVGTGFDFNIVKVSKEEVFLQTEDNLTRVKKTISKKCALRTAHTCQMNDASKNDY